MESPDGDSIKDRKACLLALSESIYKARVDDACLSTIPGAVLSARNYLILEVDTWRVACGCSACLAALCDSVESGQIVVRQLPISEVPTVELPINWEATQFGFTGPDKDPSIVG